MKNTRIETETVSKKSEKEPEIISTPKQKRLKKVSPSKTVYLELNGKQIDVSELTAKAEAIVKESNPKLKYTSIKVYVNVSEGIAYFTVDDVEDDAYKILL